MRTLHDTVLANVICQLTSERPEPRLKELPESTGPQEAGDVLEKERGKGLPPCVRGRLRPAGSQLGGDGGWGGVLTMSGTLCRRLLSSVQFAPDEDKEPHK